MPFNSSPYFLFLAVAVLGFRLLEKTAPTGRRVFLLLASYAFYAWWRADFLLLLCGSTLVNDAIGCEIERRRMQHKDRRALLIAGLVFNLGDRHLQIRHAVCRTANDLLGWPAGATFLPLAISFFTFNRSAIWWMPMPARRTISLLDYTVRRFSHRSLRSCGNDLIPHLQPRSGMTISPRHDFVHHRAGQEIPTPTIRRPPSRPTSPGLHRRLVGHPFLRLPDLFRFQRLFRHGAGFIGDAGDPPAGEFPFALQSRQHHRILAALAYFAVGLPAGLSLCAAGRQ